jgi:SAM-dependent methyltransferase
MGLFDYFRRRSTPLPAPEDLRTQDYASRLAQENSRFAADLDVHALPEIFHYWSNKYLLPMQLEFGAKHPEDFIAQYLLRAARRTGSASPRFASLGAGNCDAEVRIAQSLIANGLTDFRLECLDVNPAMLERGRELAGSSGVGEHVVPLLQDLNSWAPPRIYDGVMANQSLHHIVELEKVFDAVHSALRGPEASFVTSDMIGRNGHQRWPESLAIVREFWKEMPDTHKFNLQLRRQEDEFADWDCSVEGFEGIRSQDILPLLLERFGFEVFLGYGNVVDPFIDRGFGHHFSVERDEDTALIDRIHARDELELARGTIKPTHMMAVMSTSKTVPCRYRGNLSPTASVRLVQ